jgi:hypothetical protein
LLALRIREPELERPFRAGSLLTVCLLGVAPALLIGYAIFVSRDERMAHIPALLLGGIIAAFGPVFYWLLRAVRERILADATAD